MAFQCLMLQCRGVKGAELGNLTFIVGGSQADLEKGLSLFKIMGDKIFYAGESGSGQIAKLCNNMLLAVHMCGTAETLALGVNNGLDPVVLSEIMKNSSEEIGLWRNIILSRSHGDSSC